MGPEGCLKGGGDEYGEGGGEEEKAIVKDGQKDIKR